MSLKLWSEVNRVWLQPWSVRGGSFMGSNTILRERRDANKRSPDDENYDPTTLYLPPTFLKSLSGGQRQWWEFKSKHMDKVLFFKMGKFYELFEVDAHVGIKELNLQYMKGDQPHCGFPEKNFESNVEKLACKLRGKGMELHLRNLARKAHTVMPNMRSF